VRLSGPHSRVGHSVLRSSTPSFGPQASPEFPQSSHDANETNTASDTHHASNASDSSNPNFSYASLDSTARSINAALDINSAASLCLDITNGNGQYSPAYSQAPNTPATSVNKSSVANPGRTKFVDVHWLSDDGQFSTWFVFLTSKFPHSFVSYLLTWCLKSSCFCRRRWYDYPSGLSSHEGQQVSWRKVAVASICTRQSNTGLILFVHFNFLMLAFFLCLRIF
jgi:hypothetical protein